MPKQSVHFVSLGCPKNRVDTEVMLGLTEEAGFDLTAEADDADIIVVNTCGFIGEAKEESIDTILEMAEKKKARCRRLVVTGCLSQRYGGELMRDLPEVDQFLGSGDVDKILGALRGQLPRDGVTMDPAYLYTDVTPRLMSLPGYTAYVKIAEGCDRPCAFCIIPKLRGGQRSRDPQSVVREVRALARGGTVEVNLVAQDLTAYGADRADQPTLAALVRELAAVADEPESALRWLRLHYAYPSATSEALIAAIAEEPRIAKYVDVPMQHISDRMLKIMRRGYVARTAKGLVETLRQRVPGVTLRTTLIVGHPGETDADFDELCAWIKEVEFDRVGVFTYSAEDGTHAATLEGAVEPKVMEARRRELMRLQRAVSRRKLKAMVGRALEVLVEGPSDESEYLWQGRHAGQAPEIDGQVYLALPEGGAEGMPAPSQGDLVTARVTAFADYDLSATIEGTVQKSRIARPRGRLPVVSA